MSDHRLHSPVDVHFTDEMRVVLPCVGDVRTGTPVQNHRRRLHSCLAQLRVADSVLENNIIPYIGAFFDRFYVVISIPRVILEFGGSKCRLIIVFELIPVQEIIAVCFEIVNCIAVPGVDQYFVHGE